MLRYNFSNESWWQDWWKWLHHSNKFNHDIFSIQNSQSRNWYYYKCLRALIHVPLWSEIEVDHLLTVTQASPDRSTGAWGFCCSPRIGDCCLEETLLYQLELGSRDTGVLVPTEKYSKAMLCTFYAKYACTSSTGHINLYQYRTYFIMPYIAVYDTWISIP